MVTAPQNAEWPQPRNAEGAKIFQTGHSQAGATRGGSFSPLPDYDLCLHARLKFRALEKQHAGTVAGSCLLLKFSRVFFTGPV
jgi:hypothetical protein